MEYKIIKLIVGELQENCFILFDENKDAFIVDPGASSENIIEAIEKVATNSMDKPLENVVIESITVDTNGETVPEVVKIGQ